MEYSLEGDSEAARMFKIHPTTGTITVAQALPDTDYQVVSLVVVATDGGMSELYLQTFVSHLLMSNLSKLSVVNGHKNSSSWGAKESDK